MSIRKLLKYILLGFCLIFLATFAQLGNLTQKGPSVVSADEDDCVANNNCGNPGTSDVVFPAPGNPVPVQPAVPPVAPAPNCSPVFRYNECIACNISRPVYTDSCDGHFTTGPNQNDSQCASWCAAPSAPPAVPPAAPACPANEVVGPTQHCVGQQMCTFNIHHRSDCSTYEGGAYGCQNSSACGFNPPPAPPAVFTPVCPISNNSCCQNPIQTCGSNAECKNAPYNWCYAGICIHNNWNGSVCQAAQPPAAPPRQPNAPSCPTDFKVCPNGTGVYRNPGDGCNFFACPNVSGPASCTSSTTQQSRCVSNQLCSVNVTVNTNNVCGNTTESGPFSCQLIAGQCGYNPGSACTSSTTQESSCVGNQLCTFNNNRASDCTTSRTGPFSCQLIAGQCGYNPGSACTSSTDTQSVCVNAQLCTVNVTRNTDCTISRSGPFNCQNSAQCGFSIPPAVVTVNNPPATFVVQSFGNVGVGQTIYTPVYTQGVQYATVLPKTGLPLLAWAAGAFLPAGFSLRRVTRVKKQLESDPHYLWENRQFKVGD